MKDAGRRWLKMKARTGISCEKERRKSVLNLLIHMVPSEYRKCILIQKGGGGGGGGGRV